MIACCFPSDLTGTEKQNHWSWDLALSLQLLTIQVCLLTSWLRISLFGLTFAAWSQPGILDLHCKLTSGLGPQPPRRAHIPVISPSYLLQSSSFPNQTIFETCSTGKMTSCTISVNLLVNIYGRKRNSWNSAYFIEDAMWRVYFVMSASIARCVLIQPSYKKQDTSDNTDKLDAKLFSAILKKILFTFDNNNVICN